MSRDVPIGEREGQRLELKSRSALERPEIIARAVVSMLNAEGGEVWVGLRDQDDVGVEVEALDDAESARSRLHDSLLDRIEPSPDGGEVRVMVAGSELAVLKIAIRPRDDRRPYALLSGQAREYPVRVGARVRAMSREEIGRWFARTAAAEIASKVPGLDEAKKRLLAAQTETLAAGDSRLWLGIVPASSGGELRFEAVEQSEILIQPRLSDSPELFGWPAAFWGAQMAGQLESGTRQASGRFWRTLEGDELSLDHSGGLSASTRMDEFALSKLPQVEEDEPVIYPNRFIGWIVSAFRVLARIYSREDLWEEPPLDSSGTVLASCAVTGLAGWRLLPGLLPAPWTVPDRFERPAQRADQDFVMDEPLRLSWSAIRDEPDRCALRLLTRFYEAFGFFESDVPLFDHETGRFDWELAER